MKNRTIYTVGIFAAALAIMTVPESALARGGGGNYKGSAQGGTMGMSQTQNSYKQQHQYKQQNQHKAQERIGSPTAMSENRITSGSSSQPRERVQLRDPATHSVETSTEANE